VLCSANSEAILANEAQNVGASLARKGYKVISIAHGAVPNALALGVSQAKGSSLGIQSDTLHPCIQVSKHFTEISFAETPGAQLDLLCEGTSYFIVLSGGLDSLFIFASVLTRASYDKDGISRIYAIRDPWQGIVENMIKALRLPSSYKTIIHFVDGADEACGRLDRHFKNLHIN